MNQMITPRRNHIYHGHVIDVLRTFKPESINLIGTSPPYWAVRDYSLPAYVFPPTRVYSDMDYMECEHEWQSLPPRRKISPGDMPGPNSILSGKYIDNYEEALRPSKGSEWCAVCGAWKGQLGLEPSPHLFIEHLLQVTDELWRVLRNDGVMFMNMGDTHAGSGGAGGDWEKGSRANEPKWKQIIPKTIVKKSLCLIPYELAIGLRNRGWCVRNIINWHKPNPMPESCIDRFTQDFEPILFCVKSTKNLYHVNSKTQWLNTAFEKPLGIRGFEGVDWRWESCRHCDGTGTCKKTAGDDVGLALDSFFGDDDDAGDVEQGDDTNCRRNCREKYLKQLQKTDTSMKLGDLPDAVPCSRCNGVGVIKESYWSSRMYYFQQQFDELKDPDLKREMSYGGTQKGVEGYGNARYSGKKMYDATELQGKNKRTTWTISTAQFKGAHHATFPWQLIKPIIEAGCPRFVCTECNSPRFTLLNTTSLGRSWHDHSADLGKGQSQAHGEMSTFYAQGNYKREINGLSDCSCNAPYKPGIILDPFMGSGTTAIAARKLGRDFVGIDLSEKYIQMARKRIKSFMNMRLEQFLGVEA